MFSSTFRYDLADTVGIGLVTFSNTSRLEFPLTPVNEATRSRLADSVPDKYRWTQGGGGDCENFGAKIEQRRQKVSTEHPINEATLSRLADSVPDKYRYNEQLGGSYKNIGAKI